MGSDKDGKEEDLKRQIRLLEQTNARLRANSVLVNSRRPVSVSVELPTLLQRARSGSQATQAREIPEGPPCLSMERASSGPATVPPCLSMERASSGPATVQ